MLKVSGSLETALHVDDLSRSAGFYRRLLENERMVALIVADRNVLLLFLTGGSTEPTVVPGGVIPPHGGSGHLHLAFSIAAGEAEPCRHRLESVAVAVRAR